MGDFDNNNSAEEDAEAYAYPVPGECPACGSEVGARCGAGDVIIAGNDVPTYRVQVFILQPPPPQGEVINMDDFDNNNAADEDAGAYADPVPGVCPECKDAGTYWDGMLNFACTACGYEVGGRCGEGDVIIAGNDAPTKYCTSNHPPTTTTPPPVGRGGCRSRW